jgi:hypothetical protein
MAIPIRHKRGTSDPGSSDFSSTAELLINTADGGLFTKTDGGSVVEIGSGGGGGSGTATQITVADESSDTTCFPVFVTDGGTVPPKVDFGSLQYNSSTGNLTATTFTGSASGLTGIQLTTADETSDTTCFPVFVTDGGAQDPKVDFTNFQYNSSTGNLTATKFTGDGSGLTNLPGGGGATDLSYADATRVIASSTGTDATLPLMSSGNAGLVPASGGGTTNFLRADGTFAAPSGGGSSSLATAVYKGPSSAQTIIQSSTYGKVEIATAVGTPNAIFSNSAGEVTLGAAGTYLAMCTVVVTGSTSNYRWTGELNIEQDTGSGFAEIGSVRGGYIRVNNNSNNSYISISRIVTTADTNDKIQFQIKRTSNTSGNGTIVVDNSTIQIIRLDGIPGTQGPAGSDGADGSNGADGPSDIPQNSQTGAYTLVAGDNGKHINITTGGVTIPSGVFSAGNVVSIFNDSGSDQTITQGGSVTLRLAGSATTGNRTLAQYGLCSALCVANNEFVISGAGLS